MAKITGFKQVKIKLGKMQAATAKKLLKPAINQAALPIVQQARANIPVGTPPYEGYDPYPVKGFRGKLRTPGFAKRSIARKTIEKEGGVGCLVGVKPQAFYATQFVELGKSNAPAQPWLRPALNQTKETAALRMAERLKRIIDRAAR